MKKGSCRGDPVEEILSRRSCRGDPVEEILSRRSCRGDPVEEILTRGSLRQKLIINLSHGLLDDLECVLLLDGVLSDHIASHCIQLILYATYGGFNIEIKSA
jgi:hypothetical protein